jgi:hypothetical protein
MKSESLWSALDVDYRIRCEQRRITEFPSSLDNGKPQELQRDHLSAVDESQRGMHGDSGVSRCGYIGSMTVDYLLWVVLDNLARGHRHAQDT